jgi:hypothetical protein
MNGFTAPVYPDKKPAEPEIADAFATMTGFANRLLESGCSFIDAWAPAVQRAYQAVKFSAAGSCRSGLTLAHHP